MGYEIFARLCKERGLKPGRVAKETGVATATLSSWKYGTYKPKSEKLQKIADYFGVPLSYLTSDYSEIQDEARDTYKRLKENEMRTDGFYLDQDALDLMQIMADRPEYKTLFKAAANVKPEDIEKVKAVLDAFKKDDYAE